MGIWLELENEVEVEVEMVKKIDMVGGGDIG